MLAREITNEFVCFRKIYSISQIGKRLYCTEIKLNECMALIPFNLNSKILQ